MSGDVSEHLRGDSEGHLREAPVHERGVPWCQRGHWRPRSEAGVRLRQPRQPAVADRPRLVPSVPGPARPQPPVPQRRGQNLARPVHRAAAGDAARPRPAAVDRRARGVAQVDRSGRAARCDRRRHRRSARCLPAAAKPIPIDPLPPPPPADQGVQLHMPRWIVNANSEHEVCYSSYYDITDQVPEQYRGPERHVPLQADRVPPGSPQPPPDRQSVRGQRPA